MTKINNFYDIKDNPEYYEITEDGKDFFICSEEEFIPKNRVDWENRKYLDLHCKCGYPVVRMNYSNEEERRYEDLWDDDYFGE